MCWGGRPQLPEERSSTSLPVVSEQVVLPYANCVVRGFAGQELVGGEANRNTSGRVDSVLSGEGPTEISIRTAADRERFALLESELTLKIYWGDGDKTRTQELTA